MLHIAARCAPTTSSQWLGKALFFLVPALVVGGVGVGIFAAQTYNEGATVYLKGCVFNLLLYATACGVSLYCCIAACLLHVNVYTICAHVQADLGQRQRSALHH